MATRIEKPLLLRQLARMGSMGRAEGEERDAFPYTFYPVAEHARAFDPDVVLIVGPRGAGKTELFRAVTELGLLPAIARHARGVRLPPLGSETGWLKGYPIERQFPDSRGLARFFEARGDSARVGLDLWFAYLVRLLWDELDARGKQKNAALHKQQAGDAQANYDAFQAAGDEPLLALDRLDERLEQEGRFLFVLYDELDTLGSVSLDTMAGAVDGLVAFWASYTRRWRRIRGKIFLRSDIFERHVRSGGADLAKLAANRVELAWGDADLYAMLVKRIANQSPELLAYCRGAGIRFVMDPDLGFAPKVQSAQDASPLTERLVGQYMGANFKKGLTYRWLLQHVKDGLGNALPRPLVRLIERAAELQQKSGSELPASCLLDPAALRRAIDHVSVEHVRSWEDELPWVKDLKEWLEGHQVPWAQRDLERTLHDALLESDFVKGISARELVSYLLEAGVFRTKPDGRIDVPDLFLAGLGLKRKGGVRRG